MDRDRVRVLFGCVCRKVNLVLMGLHKSGVVRHFSFQTGFVLGVTLQAVPGSLA